MLPDTGETGWTKATSASFSRSGAKEISLCSKNSSLPMLFHVRTAAGWCEQQAPLFVGELEWQTLSSHFWIGATMSWVGTNGAASVALSRDGLTFALTTMHASKQGIDQLLWVMNPAKLAAISTRTS